MQSVCANICHIYMYYMQTHILTVYGLGTISLVQLCQLHIVYTAQNIAYSRSCRGRETKVWDICLMFGKAFEVLSSKRVDVDRADRKSSGSAWCVAWPGHRKNRNDVITTSSVWFFFSIPFHFPWATVLWMPAPIRLITAQSPTILFTLYLSHNWLLECVAVPVWLYSRGVMTPNTFPSGFSHLAPVHFLRCMYAAERKGKERASEMERTKTRNRTSSSSSSRAQSTVSDYYYHCCCCCFALKITIVVTVFKNKRSA